jgi:hypothetical protein
MPDRRELYRSPNGDTWFLGREPTSVAQRERAGTTSIVAPDRNAGGGATLCLEATIQQAMARKPDTETYA